MRAGRLRNKITVQKIEEGRDAYGGVTETWSTHADYWARIEYQTQAGETMAGDSRIRGDVTVMFTIRHDPTVSRITPDMRVRWNSRTYDIESVAVFEERNEMATITAIERGAGVGG